MDTAVISKVAMIATEIAAENARACSFGQVSSHAPAPVSLCRVGVESAAHDTTGSQIENPAFASRLLVGCVHIIPVQCYSRTSQSFRWERTTKDRCFLSVHGMLAGPTEIKPSG